MGYSYIGYIQGSQSEPLRRVRVAYKATYSFPQACASYNSVGDCHPLLREFVISRRLYRRVTSPLCYNLW